MWFFLLKPSEVIICNILQNFYKDPLYYPLATDSIEKIMQFCKITEEEALKWKSFAQHHCYNTAHLVVSKRFPVPPLNLHDRSGKIFISRQSLLKIKTGSLGLDNILGGGFETGSITEIVGGTGSGKTQLCHTLAVTCQLHLFRDKHTRMKCFFIDSNATFRPERIMQIAKRNALDEQSCLNNIICSRVFNSDHLLQLMTSHVPTAMIKEKYALLIIDSATFYYRLDYPGKRTEAYNERQLQFDKFVNQLNKLCNVFQIAVVITNNESEDEINRICTRVPTRLSIRKSSDPVRRTCNILHSPLMPQNAVQILLTGDGINDSKRNRCDEENKK